MLYDTFKPIGLRRYSKVEHYIFNVFPTHCKMSHKSRDTKAHDSTVVFRENYLQEAETS